MRMLAIIAMLAACGEPAPVSPPDAATCTCSPAADCIASSTANAVRSVIELACACPSNFVPAAPTYVTGRIVEGLPQIPGLLAGIGQFDEAGKRHAILVGYDPATAPVHESIDISTSPFVIGFGYDIDPLQKIRSAYRVISGTLRFERVCPEGVTGTVTNAALVEIDLFDNLAAIPDGCSFELPAVSFAIAGNCEPI